jgi:hypothetical protein
MKRRKKIEDEYDGKKVKRKMREFKIIGEYRLR